MKPKADLRLWIAGLAAFAVVIVLGLALLSSSDYGIADHQLAGTAERVGVIQSHWRDQGVRWLAILAMAGDLVFIGIYSLGAWRAGRSFLRSGSRFVRVVGWIVAASAVVFAVTDYTETLLEFAQLMLDRGSDWMAGMAASMQLPKVASFIVSFVGVIIAALAARRLGHALD